MLTTQSEISFLHADHWRAFTNCLLYWPRHARSLIVRYGVDVYTGPGAVYSLKTVRDWTHGVETWKWTVDIIDGILSGLDGN